MAMVPSSSGLGHRPLTARTPVRVWLGSPQKKRRNGAFFVLDTKQSYHPNQFHYQSWRNDKKISPVIFLTIKFLVIVSKI